MSREDKLRELERYRMKVLYERAEMRGFDDKEDNDFILSLREREITMIRQLPAEERSWIMRIEHEAAHPEECE